MSANSAAYVGPSDLHDATISRVERDGTIVSVYLLSCERRQITLQFVGVQECHCSADANGHMIYALAETPGCGGLRRFVFVPWDESESPKLELLAEGFAESEANNHD